MILQDRLEYIGHGSSMDRGGRFLREGIQRSVECSYTLKNYLPLQSYVMILDVGAQVRESRRDTRALAKY